MPTPQTIKFQPALIRLQHTAPNPLGRWVLWAVLAFIAAIFIWALVGKLDIVAVAEGKLVPATYVKIVQPTESGVVKEILVREGQSVMAGQVLMRMDAALSDSDLKNLTQDQQLKRLAVRRIESQLAGLPFLRQSGDPSHLWAQVDAQHRANTASYNNALDQEKAALAKAKNDLVAATEVRKKLVATLPHYIEQEAAFAKLHKDGFAGKIMATDKERERIEKQQDLKAQESIIESAKNTISQSERKIAQISADYQKQLQAERFDVVGQLEKAEAELAKQTHKHQYLELKAPQTGIIKDLATHTIGTVASPGTILMTLVPQNETLRAEVWVKNDDAGFVRPEQRARIKLNPFAFQKYGLVEGEVTQVSADASEQGSDIGAASQGKGRSGAPLAYKTIISLKSQTLNTTEAKHKLSPGMQVQAEIHLGTRTVMEYFLSPVQKAWHEAGRER